MAEATGSNLEKNIQAFGDEQLKPVEALYGVEPEKMLDKAVKIGVITERTREKIEKVLKDHLELFSRAFQRPDVHFINEEARRKAFVRAFEAVYGRFLLEDDYDLCAPDSQTVKTLRSVLKFDLEEHGFKGRSELQAVIRRLAMLKVAGEKSPILVKIKKDIRDVKKRLVAAQTAGNTAEEENLKARLVELEASVNDPIDWILKQAFAGIDPLKIIELEREHADAKAKEEALTETCKYFSGKGPGETHEKFLTIKASTITRKDVRESEAKFKKAEENKTKLDNLKDLFSEAKTSALHDLFQELAVLVPKDKDQQDDQDFDAEIAAESSSISILEKELTAELTGKKRQKNDRGVPKESSLDDRTQEKIEELKRTLREKKLVVERLKKLKANRDKFKDLAKKLRGELQKYCREYLVAFELGQNPTKPTKADVEEAKKNLDAINVEKGFEFSELGTIYESLKFGFNETFEKVKTRLEETDLTLTEKQVLENKKIELDKAKVLHTDLKAIVDRIKASKDLGINISGVDVTALVAAFEAIKIDDINFRVEDLTIFYSKYFSSLFENPASRKGLIEIFEKRLAELKDEVKNKLKAVNLAKTKAESNKNLTDAQAAKRIIEVLIADQYPDLPLDEQRKMATLILANDIGTAQIDGQYEELAQRGSAEVLDTVRLAGFKEKLIGFRYKIDEKVQQPFKGLKPENFKDWASIERLFNIGRLNHQTGFFVLAALEVFEGDTRSIQYVQTERKLKKLLAEQLDVEDRLDESGVVNIVNEAFKDQLEQARSLTQAYFNYYDSNSTGLQENKVRELNIRYEKLKEESRLGKIKETVYKKRLEALIKEARERDLMDQVDFSQSTVLADFWNSDDSEWLRGSGAAVGKYAKGKALAVGKGGLRLTGRALSGTISVGASLAGQTLLTPFRLVKYPVLAAVKPLVWFVNLFRTNKFAPINISQTVVTDVGRVTGYFKQLGTETLAGAKTAVTTIPGEEWGKEHLKAVGYRERTKVDMAALEEQAKELQEKAEATPVEIAGSPFIDFKKYKRQVEQLDKILAAKPVGGIKAEAA